MRFILKLVIVESPAKAKTISKILGKEYVVESSIGHIRDLPADSSEIPAKYKAEKWSRLGVNIEKDFEPLYVVSKGKKKQVKKLKDLLKNATELYLATDEDREGESISWHLLEVLKPKVPVKRLAFHEITESAIKAALENPRQVDSHMVTAQATRRVLDRLYGYELSPLLWRKIAPKLSAGRVQSVATRLIVEKERARMAFKSAAYMSLQADFLAEQSKFKADLREYEGQKVASSKDFDANTGEPKNKVLVLNKDNIEQVIERIKSEDFMVDNVVTKPMKTSPKPPFTTSTLQQDANHKLGFSSKRTMQVAQKLYENG
ncbi:DNA topoisomerase I, partial [bacterium]|nr:DNA topoisomerase I [bacterium]